WSEAPKVCRDAFTYIQNIVKDFVPEAEFNEMLSAIYMEGQRMSWHDDGEKGVSPVIASLSLGSPAEMKFRRKQKKKESKLSKLKNVAEQTNTSASTNLGTRKNKSRANKRKKLNDGNLSQDNQYKPSIDENNSSKGEKEKDSEKVESETHKVEQIAESITKIQIPSFK